MKDQARTKTDKRLKRMESDIKNVYSRSTVLKRAINDFKAYMDFVSENTQELYDAYLNAEKIDEKATLKKKYEEAVLKLTIHNDKYKKLIKRITEALAQVNEEALEVSNDAMIETYVENYNQVAEDCKKVGINVEG